MKPNEIVPLIKETHSAWNEDKAPRLAAALAYYTVFSLAPLVLLVISIAGFFLGKEAASGQIEAQIRHTVGAPTAQAIQEIVKNASDPGGSVMATAVGLVTLLLGASGVFGQLQDALNTIWGVAPKPGRSILATLKDRFISMSMVLGIGFMLLVSLVLSAVLSGVTKFMDGVLPGGAWLAPILDLGVSFVVITVLLAMIYKILPDAKIEWRDVWVGAGMTALLFSVGKILLGWYLGRSSVGSAYGAAGSLVVLLLWVYYSAQILLFGAEFTKSYAQKYGSRILPEEDAIALTAEARAEQGIPEKDEKGNPILVGKPSPAMSAASNLPPGPDSDAGNAEEPKPWSHLPVPASTTAIVPVRKKAPSIATAISRAAAPMLQRPGGIKAYTQLAAGLTLSGAGIFLVVRDLLAHRPKKHT